MLKAGLTVLIRAALALQVCINIGFIRQLVAMELRVRGVASVVLDPARGPVFLD